MEQDVMRPTARLLHAACFVASLLFALPSCITAMMWSSTTRSRTWPPVAHGVDVEALVIADAAPERFAISLDALPLGDLEWAELPWLDRTTATLWIQPIDRRAWSEFVRLAAAEPMPPAATLEIVVWRGMLTTSVEATLAVVGSIEHNAFLRDVPGVLREGDGSRYALRLPCRIHADSMGVPGPVEAAPFQAMDLVVTHPEGFGARHIAFAALTPVTVAIDIVLLPLEVIGGILLMKAAGY